MTPLLPFYKCSQPASSKLKECNQTMEDLYDKEMEKSLR